MVTATIFTVFKANTKETKRGGAAEGRITSFVVAAASRHLCILALNTVNIVAVTTILVLHVGVIGHHFLAIRASCFLAVRAMSMLNEFHAVSPVDVVLWCHFHMWQYVMVRYDVMGCELRT